MPDRSRPGLTTTATGAVVQQGVSGNSATVGQRQKRGGKQARKRIEKKRSSKVALRVGTLNVGTMSGRGREVADMMERRKLDILCVQETKWKGSKARNLGGGCKLFYHGEDGKRNGVGIIVKEEYVASVLEVNRVSGRLMRMKLDVRGVRLNVICAYAPQVGCEEEEKESFWNELDVMVESLPRDERIVIGADLNGHVGQGNKGDEEVIGRYGVKERNPEGQKVVDFAKRMNLAVVNTYFRKKEEHRVTYKSGGRCTQVDYILVRRSNLKEIGDCKVMPGESVARQHRVVIARMKLQVRKKRTVTTKPRIKWWRLSEDKCFSAFQGEARKALRKVEETSTWQDIADTIREIGRNVCGVSSGKRKCDKETWWWNPEVQLSVKEKRTAKKNWDMLRDDESKQKYKEASRKTKREVAKAKAKAYEQLYERLETTEGEKDVYRLARQRQRAGEDIAQVKIMKDCQGNVLADEECVLERWRDYFCELMNVENPRQERVVQDEAVIEDVQLITKKEVRLAVSRMKNGKAVGPDEIPVEAWKCIGEPAIEVLTGLFNRLLKGEKMPDEWRKSILIPVFKKKGDAQNCSNYRGIKLMSHSMKIWERVVEARLRQKVQICEQQYGFMPRKSTTDAIFALRLLIEKYREGQKELHCVFVDLEKAYDRVPREELWHSLRKSSVPEVYIKVIQDMYDGCVTAVRSAVGTTEEFSVKVGLHQGSALSPFLFAIVMDRLTDDIRETSPWNMMFADDIVLCSESREEVENSLEKWRHALETRGMKVSRSKTQYMVVNEKIDGQVNLQGIEIEKVEEFKYLGSTVQSNGECSREVKRRVQAGWNGWRRATGVICDRKISARMKGKMYKVLVRPAVMYGLETVALTKRQEAELEVAEMKMLRFSLGVTRLDKIKNEIIRGTAHVRRLRDKLRESRLRWFGHVQRRPEEYVGRKMLQMQLPGKRRRGRPKRRYMDGLNEDMNVAGVTVKDASDRTSWRKAICCGDP